MFHAVCDKRKKTKIGWKIKKHYGIKRELQCVILLHKTLFKELWLGKSCRKGGGGVALGKNNTTSPHYECSAHNSANNWIDRKNDPNAFAGEASRRNERPEVYLLSAWARLWLPADRLTVNATPRRASALCRLHPGSRCRLLAGSFIIRSLCVSTWQRN